MRPAVDASRTRRPAPAGIALHYVVFIGLVAAFLWAVVPRAIDQVDEAIRTCRRPAPTSASRPAT